MEQIYGISQMGVSQLQAALSGKTNPGKQHITIKDTITEELIFALCGPIGSPIHKVAETFKKTLETQYEYECVVIRLSEFIAEDIRKTDPGKVDNVSAFKRLSLLIDHGDEMRKKYRPSYLSELGIQVIARSRIDDLDPEEKQKLDASPDAQPRFRTRRKCFLIDSIKNQEELETFRSVYRDLFYFIGVFSPISKREQELIAKGMSRAEAYALIEKDAGDGNPPEDAPFGQTVRKTFPLADLFIRVDSGSDEQLKQKVDRFLHLIFNTKITTPTTAENAMYLAAAAAGNSACLSRQVGACLTDVDGNVISIGWNDVPKFGGHLYQFNSNDITGAKDLRCMNIENGKCHNQVEKQKLAKDIAERIIGAKLSDPENSEKLIDIILNSRLKNLIEFSRAIHAEMLALVTAGENCGSKIKGSSLYCTTYPCHNCARHLIAAGVTSIFYIEPFPKSLAVQLHFDSITEQESDETKVRILAFDGISPNRYLEFFTYHQDDRKRRLKEGGLRASKVSPKTEVTLESMYVLEGIIVKRLKGG